MQLGAHSHTRHRSPGRWRGRARGPDASQRFARLGAAFCPSGKRKFPCPSLLIRLAAPPRRFCARASSRKLSETLRGQGSEPAPAGRYIPRTRSPQESPAGAAGPGCAARGRRGPREARARVAFEQRRRALELARAAARPSAPFPIPRRTASAHVIAHTATFAAAHLFHYVPTRASWLTDCSKSCRRSEPLTLPPRDVRAGKPMLGGVLRPLRPGSRVVPHRDARRARPRRPVPRDLHRAGAEGGHPPTRRARPHVGPGEGLPPARRPRDAAAVRALGPLPRPRPAPGLRHA